MTKYPIPVRYWPGDARRLHELIQERRRKLAYLGHEISRGLYPRSFRRSAWVCLLTKGEPIVPISGWGTCYGFRYLSRERKAPFEGRSVQLQLVELGEDIRTGDFLPIHTGWNSGRTFHARDVLVWLLIDDPEDVHPLPIEFMRGICAPREPWTLDGYLRNYPYPRAEDPLPLMVYADWLEEQGHRERAGDIRIATENSQWS